MTENNGFPARVSDGSMVLIVDKVWDGGVEKFLDGDGNSYLANADTGSTLLLTREAEVEATADLDGEKEGDVFIVPASDDSGDQEVLDATADAETDEDGDKLIEFDENDQPLDNGFEFDGGDTTESPTE